MSVARMVPRLASSIRQRCSIYARAASMRRRRARLLTYAFAEQIVETIPVESLREAIERRFLGDQALSELKEALASP